MGIRKVLLAMMLCTLAFASWPAVAEDGLAGRKEAADRYLRVVPMGRMLEDSYAEIAKELPPEQREAFLTQMRGIVRVEALERITRDALVNTFTTDELNALADFYGSRHGASAISKFGPYMAQVMPPLLEEVQRALEELQAAKQ